MKKQEDIVTLGECYVKRRIADTADCVYVTAADGSEWEHPSQP